MGRPRKWTTPLQLVSFRVPEDYYPRILEAVKADNAPSLQAWLHNLVIARVSKVAAVSPMWAPGNCQDTIGGVRGEEF